MSTALSLRAFEYWRFQYRRTWRGTIVTSILNPLLYLAAMGIGLGTLVKGQRASSLGTNGSYLEFVAPALVATTAFQTGMFEAMYPVMASIKWIKTYVAMLASPLGTRDVLNGHLMWMVLRILQTSAAFLVIGALFGGFPSWDALWCLPIALLLGMAAALPMTAFSAHTQQESSFAAIQRFIIIPMFLFSGTFFPLSKLPLPLEVVAWLTPLSHGVALARSAAQGRLELLPTVGHVGYLALWCVVGFWLAHRIYRRRLRP
ncbi:MAG: lipooligosaccharide transport system permease protein [Frankiales bacterium]|nr:lipooligosaccharide transport system permease protein [Frankiales bacterium]